MGHANLAISIDSTTQVVAYAYGSYRGTQASAYTVQHDVVIWYHDTLASFLMEQKIMMVNES